jgi:hypothetical protein
MENYTKSYLNTHSETFFCDAVSCYFRIRVLPFLLLSYCVCVRLAWHIAPGHANVRAGTVYVRLDTFRVRKCNKIFEINIHMPTMIC